VLPAVLLSASWLAQTSTDFPALAQYGLAGVVIIVLARFAQTTVARMAKELEAERAYSRTLTERIETQIIPAALRLAEVADRMTRHMEQPR
jgi:hypothetical protein